MSTITALILILSAEYSKAPAQFQERQGPVYEATRRLVCHLDRYDLKRGGGPIAPHVNAWIREEVETLADGIDQQNCKTEFGDHYQ